MLRSNGNGQSLYSEMLKSGDHIGLDTKVSVSVLVWRSDVAAGSHLKDRINNNK